jgi:diguanylate cyclase (GGDEF)-like protein/PAS domain S-box-containing protein
MSQEADRKVEEGPAVYKTLLESTKAIPWKIEWATMQFAYIGPQIEPLLGWTPASWMTVQDWADRMHPDDRDRVVNFCVSQSQAGIDHEADYRALTKDGGYVWIRDVVHVVRKEDGSVDALVGFMFDISDRKLAEEKVMRLQQELHDLSFKDSLTGIANRRKYDEVMSAEWQHAIHAQEPLSLVLIDIDFFKEYNDLYGHVRGDTCLKQVVNALSTTVTRPRDFIARFGGEEFVIVLPQTDADGAKRVAERCRDVIQQSQISHRHSKINSVVTISAGAGTVVPTTQSDIVKFVDLVDTRLYQAKDAGRNCVVAG